MLPSNASVEELVGALEAPDFDAVREVNAVVSTDASLQDQHPASVALMARLNTYTQDLVQALEQSLRQLQKSEKRLPHEIDLLKNDVHTFNAQQADAMPRVAALANEGRRNAVLAQLANLQEVRRRISSVRGLLLASQSPQAQTPELKRQLADVFANTPDEAKWTASSQNYYDFINKIIK